MHRINLLHQIETESNITVATGHRCTGIQAGWVTAAAPDGSEVSFAADTVVMAAGMRPDQDEVDRLMALVPESYVVGDAFGPGRSARPPGTRSTPWWTWGCDCDRIRPYQTIRRF